MDLFRCLDCAAKDATIKAKDEHLTFLQGLVRDLQAKLLEVATLGTNARLAAAERLTLAPLVPVPKKATEDPPQRRPTFLPPFPGL